MRFRCYASTCIRNHNPGSEHNPIAMPRESICFSLASIGSTSHWKHSVKLKSWLSCRYKVNTFLLLLLFSHLSCVRLFCDPVDCSLPGSSVHGISLASILEWVAISFSRYGIRAMQVCTKTKQSNMHTNLAQALSTCLTKNNPWKLENKFSFSLLTSLGNSTFFGKTS